MWKTLGKDHAHLIPTEATNTCVVLTFQSSSPSSIIARHPRGLTAFTVLNLRGTIRGTREHQHIASGGTRIINDKGVFRYSSRLIASKQQVNNAALTPRRAWPIQSPPHPPGHHRPGHRAERVLSRHPGRDVEWKSRFLYMATMTKLVPMTCR